VLVLVGLILLLAGCQPTTPVTKVPAVPVPGLTLHAFGKTFTVHGISYYATAKSGSEGAVVFVIRATNTTDSTIAVIPRIEPVVYGSDATVRPIVEDSSEASGLEPPSMPEGVPSQTAGLVPGGTVSFDFSVVPKQSDAGLVVGLTVQPGLEIRWLLG
jgi:hypothetical protein